MRTQRALLSILLLIIGWPLLAEQVHPSLVFRSMHQSIWGPGAAAPPSSKRFTIVDPATARWNVATSGFPAYDGEFWEADTEWFGVADFGAGVRGRSKGHTGLWFDMNIANPGSVDVVYPVTPAITFPDANSFRAGDTVAIKTSYMLDGGWTMTTTSPQFDLSLKGSFALEAEMSARLCVFDCEDAHVVPKFARDTGEFHIFTVRPGDKLETPPWFGEFTAWSGSIGVPDIQTTATLHGDGTTLLGAGTDEFMTLALDLTTLAEAAAKAKIPLPPLSFSTSDYPMFDDFTGIHLSYNIINVQAVARLSARQSFRFDPDLKVTFRFAQPLEHWTVSGGTAGPAQTSSTAEVRVGDTLYVKYPETDKQPTKVNPTFRLDNTFESVTGFGLKETLETTAAAFGAKIPEIEVFPEICIPSTPISPEICTPAAHTDEAKVSVGPLLDNTLNIAAQDLGNIFSGTWQLQGFEPVAIDAFALDPENPIVTIDQRTGAARNLGSGRRQVAYAVDFSNGGDVLLSNVHLVADLAAAFAQAHSFKVDQVIGCDVATNPDFNGVSVKELLAARTKLDVGERGRVILLVSVWPKPDPQPYTSTSTVDGTSPLDTFVTATDSSSVLLGPGAIASADDYVLYADHSVKLDSIADSFGHIGASDFVEVKNGNSGVVAGDLRAGRVIKVQGSITADYAIAGGVVDVVKSAKLTLTGNAKPFANVPSYTKNVPAFNPPTSFNGNAWVENGGSRTLHPGYFGDVTVNAGATLTLDPGSYHFISLVVMDGARVDLPRGGTIHVQSALKVGNNARVAVGGAVSSRDGVINAGDSGEIRISQGASIRGTLNAPRANVTFEERSRLEGSAYAKSITLRAGASAAYHRDCDRLVDPDCNGSANCSANAQ